MTGASGGHIAGIVNPPGPKGWYLTADDNPPTPEQWRAAATRHQGSWWEDWARWGSERAGNMIDPPRLGSDRHPVISEGTGGYVVR